MPSYHYSALGQAGNELGGVIDAKDEAAARAHLNELGLSVLSLNTAMTAPAAPAVQDGRAKITYEFQAIDRKQKQVMGTIVSENSAKAFARLTEEYQLNVLLLTEKETAKPENIEALRQEYEKTTVSAQSEVTEEQARTAAQAMARKELIEKVEFTMKRIETFLTASGTDLKTDERKAIQGYLNQLVRIKDSTNLEHIRTTCERMLEHVQKQELFLNQEQKLKESAKVKVETQELLTQLKRTGMGQEIDFVKTASKWQKNKFFGPLANLVLRLFQAKNPEVMALREQLKTANLHFWSYAKLMITGKSKEVRKEAWNGLITVRQEKERIRQAMRALKQKDEHIRLAEAASSNQEENGAGRIAGWVLSFYLATYFITYPLTLKQFSLPKLPKNFFFYQSQITTIITIFLFFLFSALTIRSFWFKKYASAPLILYPLTIFGFLLFAVNLL